MSAKTEIEGLKDEPRADHVVAAPAPEPTPSLGEASMKASVDQVRKLQVRKIGAQEKLATYNDEVLRAAIAAEQEASDSRPLMIAMLQGEIDRRAKEGKA